MNHTLAHALTGQGAPLLLVHSVSAVASAAEVRPLYEHYSATRTVFALDLPGFGDSERSDRNDTPRLMTDALHSTAPSCAVSAGSGPSTRWRCRWAVNSWRAQSARQHARDSGPARLAAPARVG